MGRRSSRPGFKGKKGFTGKNEVVNANLAPNDEYELEEESSSKLRHFQKLKQIAGDRGKRGSSSRARNKKEKKKVLAGQQRPNESFGQFQRRLKQATRQALARVTEKGSASLRQKRKDERARREETKGHQGGKKLNGARRNAGKHEVEGVEVDSDEVSDTDEKPTSFDHLVDHVPFNTQVLEPPQFSFRK